MNTPYRHTYQATCSTDSLEWAPTPPADHAPMQLLITALVQCTVITLDGIMRKQRRNVTRYTITVTAIQRAALPQLWETIDLAIVCHGSGLDDASAARALTIAQHYCPVHVTLAHTAVIHDAITTTGGTP